MKVLVNSGRTTPFLGTRKDLVCSIVDRGHELTLTGFQTGYEERLASLGAEFVEMPVDRAGLNPIKDVALLISYYRLIKRSEIEVVHSYTIKPNIYGSIAARLAGVKRVFPTINGLGYAFTGKGVRANTIRIVASVLYWIAFRCCEKVFFHNKDDIEELVSRRLVDRDKCVLIDGSGINLCDFPEQAMPESISFILVSRLLKAKGVFEYLQAAQKVKKTYPQVCFKLVGPVDSNPTGIGINEIQPYIDDGTVVYFGEQGDIRPFLKTSAVAVLPSYREGLPHSLLEAMATGRAILTTDAPGCRETVIDGQNGFLVPVGDVESLADRMCWMIEHPWEVALMGKESLKLVKKRFEVGEVNHVILSTMEL